MITGQTVKNTYQGDGVNREFTITFEFTDASQVKFKVNGQEVTTNFALNTVAKTLTYPTVESELDPLTSADEIEIYRDTVITQDIEFNNGGPLNAKMIEDGLDKLTMISQELKDKVEDKSDLIVLPDGTDIDSLRAEGKYFIKNPICTTGGMPIVPRPSGSNPTKNASYAIIEVTLPPIEKGTYFIHQEMTLWYQYTGADSLNQPQKFIRDLTDYTYIHDEKNKWNRLGKGYACISLNTTTIDCGEYKGCQIIINGSGGPQVVPNTAISSLTITNVYARRYSADLQIIFKADSGFTLNTEDVFFVGEVPTFVQDKMYMITITGEFAKIEEVTM